MLLAGIFCMFLPVGLLNDISILGGTPLPRLLGEVAFSGAIAVVYVLVARWPRWLPFLIGGHVVVSTFLFGGQTPRSHDLTAAHARLVADTRGIIAAIAVSFLLLTRFVQREGLRHVRAHTEIALASQIHRLLVPPVDRRIGAFTFHGISVASGEVGGDLVDVVESERGWIAYVADVSGHGVVSGLLMGMVKSAMRMQLLSPKPLGRLLTDLSAVLFDVKRPEMFVTLAGLQFDGASGLQFSVARHLP